MPFFVEKPSKPVEAVQWVGDMSEIIEVVGHDLPTYGEGRSGSLRLLTIYGETEVASSDWIIRVEGGFVVMRDADFQASYDWIGH